MIAALEGPKGCRNTLRHLERFTCHRVKGAEEVWPVPGTLVGRLLRGTDREVLRMAPAEPARLWGGAVEDVLRVLLHDTREGLQALS